MTRLSNQEVFPGIDGLLPLVYPELDDFLSYLPVQSLCIRIDPDRQDAAVAEFQEQAQANHAAGCDAGKFCVPPERLYLPWEEVRQGLQRLKSIAFKLLEVTDAAGDAADGERRLLNVRVQSNAELSSALRRTHGKEQLLQPLADWIWQHKRDGHRVLVTCRTKIPGRADGLPARALRPAVRPFATGPRRARTP